MSLKVASNWHSAPEPPPVPFRSPGTLKVVPASGVPEPRFPGLAHAEALKREIPATAELVAGIIEAGTLGTIAGLPETHKSFLANQITYRVAAGAGHVLGRQIRQAGAVSYWWQDDSEANELRRIQDYAPRHGFPAELPIRWHLNEGLLLPDHLDDLRAEIEDNKQVLCVLDSAYNFLGGRILKDQDVGDIYAAIKAKVCDPTGCAVLIVDHAPWPSDSNRGQRRAYGSVFKAAAIRWGIYIERDGQTLHIEARGNNLAGLPRTVALWDPEALELRIVEPPAETSSLADAIATFLERNIGATTTVVCAGVKGKDRAIRDELERSDLFVSVPPVMFGKPSNSTCWARVEDVSSLLNTTPAPERADVGPTLPAETDCNPGPDLLPPVGGEGRAEVGSHPRPESGTTVDGEPVEDGGW